MSNHTHHELPVDEPGSKDRFRFIKTEVVSGGTQAAAAPEVPDPVMQIMGGVLWIGGLGLLAYLNTWFFVVVLGIIVSVILHELGHFWTARKSGMKATQFFVGMGPRVWSTHRDGVEYGLRVLPLGGFVKIIGMTNVDEVEPDDEAVTYRQGSYARRMWVITAGSAMHMIIALLLITGVYAAWGSYKESGQVTIYAISDGTPATRAGLQLKDVITAVDSTKVTTAAELRHKLAATVPGTTVTLHVLRDGTPLELSATLAQSPNVDEGVVAGFLGVSSDSQERVHMSLGQALVDGPHDLVTGVGQAVVGVAKVINPVTVFGHLTGSNKDVTTRPGTVVGVTRVSANVAKYDGWAGILTLLAMINVSVGVFNMFPLLPLDGGHAAIATYERVRSRRGKRYYADVNKLMPVAAVCIMLLAFMFLTGLYLDTVKG